MAGEMEPGALAARIDGAVLAGWQRAPQRELARLGRRLRELGLTERALLYCFGAKSPVRAPEAARARAGRGGAIAPAALMAHLWVAGSAIAEDRLRARLGGDLDRLGELGLLVCDRGRVWATVAVLPVGGALVVSDRADVRSGRDVALFADDSAMHMAGVVPRRVGGEGRWLDVGTGSGLVPLARPGAAAQILGTDVNARALAMARLGAGLSGVEHFAAVAADLWECAGECARCCCARCCCARCQPLITRGPLITAPRLAGVRGECARCQAPRLPGAAQGMDAPVGEPARPQTSSPNTVGADRASASASPSPGAVGCGTAGGRVPPLSAARALGLAAQPCPKCLGAWDLITFNAPIPDGVVEGGGQAPGYVRGEADVLARFWNGVGALLARDGEVVVHSWQPQHGYPERLGLPGQVVALTYTPPGHSPAFGITVWNPRAPSACRRVWIALDERTPYVTRAHVEGVSLSE